MLSLIPLIENLINMKFLQLFKIVSAPLIFLVILFNTNPRLSELKAGTKTTPANDQDLEFYQRMGVAYVCSASRGNESEFRKILSVATNLLTTVLEQKHGGSIKQGRNKPEKIDPQKLYGTIDFQLIGLSMQFCKDNVPKEIQEDFKAKLEKIRELKK